MPLIEIEVIGSENLIANLDRFKNQLADTLAAAGRESASEILNTEGLRKYPPASAANQPPTPYYIRGRGTQYKTRNDGRSERYGTKWTVTTSGYATVIGNNASYAQYLGGENASRLMAWHGWRRLIDVAAEKLPEIARIYQAWIDRLIQRLGL